MTTRTALSVRCQPAPPPHGHMTVTDFAQSIGLPAHRVLRAIREGSLLAVRDERDARRWVIPDSELARVQGVATSAA